MERRKKPRGGRREDDEAQAVIVDHAVHDAPLVHRLLQTGKVAAAVAAISLPLGGVGAAVGMKVVGPADGIAVERLARERADSLVHSRIDYNQATIAQLRRSTDSLVAVLGDMRSELRLNSYAQCAMMRKLAPELRAPGCDAATRPGPADNP